MPEFVPDRMLESMQWQLINIPYCKTRMPECNSIFIMFRNYLKNTDTMPEYVPVECLEYVPDTMQECVLDRMPDIAR